MKRLIEGAVAGTGATVPMTVGMVWMHRKLPPEQQYPLPPRQIIENIAPEQVPPEQRKNATLVSHFAYGAACGAIYRILPLPGNRIATGMLFGLAVWAGSYLGWLPAAGILPPATEHPKERNALMISAHLIWGASLGALLAKRDAAMR